MISRRDMKNYNIYREGAFKAENEPEEGEIVDEFDLIVSSDEELSMRQRIRELEAENDEIEQIAVISRSYVDKINPPHTYLENSRAAQVPTDASSISSTEFVTPKKRKRRKSREHKRKHCHHHQHEHHHQYGQHLRYNQQQTPPKIRSRKTHCKRRQKLFAKKYQKIHSDRYQYKDINVETVALESPASSDSSSSLTDIDNYSKNWLSLNKKEDTYGKCITRDTLRMAVARNSNESISLKKSCLKDKLLRQGLDRQPPNIVRENRYAISEGDEVQNDDEEDDDVQVIENEPDIQTVDEDSTDSMEEKELRLIALKSAVLRKHMARKMRNAEDAYSPTDFDEMLSSGILRQDNKLNDIDVVDLEADDSQNACVTVSPVASPQLMMLDDQEESQQMVDCKPVDMDIANSDSEDTTIGSWSKDVEPALPTFPLSHEFANHYHYGYYMPELHELPPPPPGVDDYENVPPAPPYHKIYNADMQDMELDNEELTEEQHWLENTKNCNQETSKQTGSDRNSIMPEKPCHDDVEDEEEEEALRALLLSKFQSPKNQKKFKKLNNVIEGPAPTNSNEMAEQSNNNPKKPTEFILKEAVKRLKIHSQTELIKEEASSVDLKSQSKCELSTQPLECSKNTADLSEKLRNRLNKYKNKQNTNQPKENSNQHDYEEKELAENLEDIKAHPDDMCNVSNIQEYETFSNTLQVTKKIDISDITRRLQQIKENVLKQTHHEPIKDFNSSSQIHEASQQSNESFQVLRNTVEEDQPPLGNSQMHHNLLNNNLNNNELNINNSLAEDKTVEANFDVATNKTTFKVTITNREAIQADENLAKVKVNDVSFKENKAINVSSNRKLNANVDSKNKVLINGERSVKVKNTNTGAQIVTTSAVIKPVVTKAQVSATQTYTLLRTTKIVKPNKVINANFDLNRRQISPATEPSSATKSAWSEVNNQLPDGADNSRLITSIDQVKHMCKIAPIVISVQNSSNESSGDECSADYDSLYKPLYDYNDNTSPLSLNLESPSLTPLRSNSPTDPLIDCSTKNTELDAFLNKVTSSVPSETTQSNGSDQCEKMNKTPLAVRHLPAAAQSEYRRLVHRMKLLENKRKLDNVDNNEKEWIASKANDCCSPVTGDPSKDKTDLITKTSLVKKVLIRNANNNTTTTSESQTINDSMLAPKFHKSNILRSYENLYIKFGAGIVNNLDKSLKLVEEAKKSKVTKLKLEHRLKELKTEMEILQSKHKEEQQKISRIYPSICSTNEVITSLKQKRSKVFKAAINLGKSLKGEDYRLNNEMKESITTKSKQLATEIKMINSLKAQDVISMENTLKTSCTKELTENKKKTLEDCKTKSNRENIENKVNANTAAICSERDTEKEGENELESTTQSNVGGNTEFQKLESNSAPSPVASENTYRTEMDTKSNTTDVEMDCKKTLTLPSYISPLEHLRNIDSNVDPNGVICPYDLMGNCEDATCKYVHITPKAKT